LSRSITSGRVFDEQHALVTLVLALRIAVVQADLVGGAHLLEDGLGLRAPFVLCDLVDGGVDGLHLRVSGVDQERGAERRRAFAVHGRRFKQIGKGKTDIRKFDLHDFHP
jgi:hypothetical protein